jgi:hypothetical protein
MAHRHRTKTTDIYCYNSPIVGAKYERRAHGAVCIVDRCACGATRACNSNGQFQEQGPWRAPENEVRS